MMIILPLIGYPGHLNAGHRINRALAGQEKVKGILTAYTENGQFPYGGDELLPDATLAFRIRTLQEFLSNGFKVSSI